MFWLIVTAVIVVGVYVFLIKPLKYWEERGVSHEKPWPIVGNMANVLFRRKHFMDHIKDIYETFPEKRYIGFFQFFKPMLMVRDLELVKRITVKDFDHFTDHQVFSVSEDVDPMMGKNLVSLKGQQWRGTRAMLSPSFTGSKMRGMFPLITECAEQFTDYFVKKTERKLMEVQLEDVFTRFTNDAIATCAFGLKCDSLRERQNEFYMMGKEAANFSGIRSLIIFLTSISPSLMKALGLKFFPDHVANFFRQIIKETIQLREEGLIRPDLVHLLMEARKASSKQEDHLQQDIKESDTGKTCPKQELTDEDITAHALGFFFGGFDTSSSLMCLTAYTLAVHPVVQKKLQREIDETVRRWNGKLTYEAVMEMKYMDMVVTETLRMWPLGFFIDRLCVQDYTIEPEQPGEEALLVKRGDVVLIPVIGIHHDPKYYPSPEKFDPERFSDDNRHNIQPNAYMPFGSGPRACIASRFALLVNKALFAHLLSKFDLIAIEKTKFPLIIDPASFTPMPKGGFWIGFQQRKAVKA